MSSRNPFNITKIDLSKGRADLRSTLSPDTLYIYETEIEISPGQMSKNFYINWAENKEKNTPVLFPATTFDSLSKGLHLLDTYDAEEYSNFITRITKNPPNLDDENALKKKGDTKFSLNPIALFSSCYPEIRNERQKNIAKYYGDDTLLRLQRLDRNIPADTPARKKFDDLYQLLRFLPSEKMTPEKEQSDLGMCAIARAARELRDELAPQKMDPSEVRKCAAVDAIRVCAVIMAFFTGAYKGFVIGGALGGLPGAAVGAVTGGVVGFWGMKKVGTKVSHLVSEPIANAENSVAVSTATAVAPGR